MKVYTKKTLFLVWVLLQKILYNKRPEDLLWNSWIFFFLTFFYKQVWGLLFCCFCCWWWCFLLFFLFFFFHLAPSTIPSPVTLLGIQEIYGQYVGLPQITFCVNSSNPSIRTHIFPVHLCGGIRWNLKNELLFSVQTGDPCNYPSSALLALFKIFLYLLHLSFTMQHHLHSSKWLLCIHVKPPF